MSPRPLSDTLCHHTSEGLLERALLPHDAFHTVSSRALSPDHISSRAPELPTAQRSAQWRTAVIF